MLYLDLKFVEGIACFVQDITKKEKKVLEYKMLFLKCEKWWVFFLMACNRSGRKLCNEMLWEYHKLFEHCLSLQKKA